MVFAEKEVGFYLAYLLPTVVFLRASFLSLCLDSLSNRTPSSLPPRSLARKEPLRSQSSFRQAHHRSLPLQRLTLASAGSVLSTSLRLVRHAGKGKWTSPKALASETFWEDAQPSKIPVEARPAWMTYDDNYVSEVKRGLKACKVFMW